MTAERSSASAWGREAWIGLAGHAGSGKDTAAGLLGQYGWQRVSFADPLKDLAVRLGWGGHKAPRSRLARFALAVVRMFGAKYGARPGLLAIEQHLDGRLLLQALGHGARETVDTDVWVNAAANRARGRFAVFSDVRYPNEVDLIRDHGGVMVWIDRPGFRPVNSQPSENSIGPMDCDLTVRNDGTVEDLHDTLLDAIDAWIEDRAKAEAVSTEVRRDLTDFTQPWVPEPDCAEDCARHTTCRKATR